MFSIVRDGTDLYLYWDGELIGKISIADWSYAIAHIKQARSGAA